MQKDLQKILIIQTAFIGDVVLATPLIEALSEAYPNIRIDVLLRKVNEGLLQGHPKIHKLLIWDKKQNKIKNLFGIISAIRKEKYDAVFNVQRFFSSGLITVLSGAKYTAGFDKNPLSFAFSKKLSHEINKTGTLHETERNLRLIEDFVKPTKAVVKLYPSQEDYEKVAPYKKEKYIVIAPASVWFTKQFPDYKWADFVKHLDKNMKVYFLGAASDKEMAEKIIRESECSFCLNLCGQFNMLESAALMRDAEMNYVNDSAPMHFASAVNARVCAVYCSTVPAFGFGPVSEQSFVVETEEKLQCRPCGLHGKSSCPEGHFDCANKIKTTQLLSILKQ